MQALECFQRANEAAGGNADYTARIKVLKQKTSSQQKVAKVRGHVCPGPTDLRARLLQLQAEQCPASLPFLLGGSEPQLQASYHKCLVRSLLWL